MEEHFDVCTPDGAPTGRSVPRSEAHRLGLWHRSSHLWITDGRGALLLQQRHPDKQTDPGRWDIAVAGHLSAGQSPLDALIREAKEELGLDLDTSSVTFLGTQPQEYVDAEFIDREWQHLYAATWSGSLSSLVLQAEEVVAVRWMGVEQYARAIAVGDPAYVDRRDDWEPFSRWLADL